MSLYIFDKDGTVVATLRAVGVASRPPLRCEDQVLKPGVFEKLAALRAAGHRLALATNQEAVANGLLSLEQAETLVKNCAAKLGGVDAWRVCPFAPHAKRKLHGQPNPYARDDETRKPHAGMILDLMAVLGSTPADTIMVGNTHKDRAAAKAAGVRYIPASKFFDY